MEEYFTIESDLHRIRRDVGKITLRDLKVDI